MSALTAIDIVGKSARDDYTLRPREHADQYRDNAPALAAILDSSSISAIADEYEDYNDAAKAARDVHDNASVRSNIAVLLAALLGGLSMSLLIVFPENTVPGWLSVAVSLATALVGAAGGFWIFQIRENNLLEDWMQSRASAETARIDLFSQIGSAATDPKNKSALQLLLEYFRRYQFDMQSTYYRERQKDHKKSAQKTTLIGAIGTVVTGLAATGIAGGWLSASGFFGIAGASVIAFSVAREQLTQDRRNAERYGRTLNALRQIKRKLTDVREAAANGQSQPVVELIAAVNEQCSLEHRQWLESGEGAKQGLAKLEAALNAGQKDKTPTKKSRAAKAQK